MGEKMDGASGFEQKMPRGEEVSPALVNQPVWLPAAPAQSWINQTPGELS